MANFVIRENKEPKIEVEVIYGVEGRCLSINGIRVAGPKPWGGGRVVERFDVDPTELQKALKKNES